MSNIPKTDIETATNYGQGDNNPIDLVNIFPVTKFYTLHLTRDSGQSYGYFLFPEDQRYGTNYAVYSSTIYNYRGSAGTYNEFAFAPVVVITNRQNNGFTWNISSGTGDNKNVYIIFMVTYSPEIPDNTIICNFNQSNAGNIPDDGTNVQC